ncbi:MAG: toprim domain-containing protein [Methanothrix sp.]|jgi:5S rRNA maturation endonuclease (ribonuclease M5)|nr:topoisomerase [Methanothrix sp.]
MTAGRDDQESRPKRTYDLEGLEELIASLIDASYLGAAVIVEGRRDLQALRALGLPGPVIMASRRSALDLAEDAARSYARIILLTDWDDKGDEMCKTIERHLRSVGSRPDSEIRCRLKKLVKKEIKDVESLSRYAERMREQYGT